MRLRLIPFALGWIISSFLFGADPAFSQNLDSPSVIEGVYPQEEDSNLPPLEPMPPVVNHNAQQQGMYVEFDKMGMAHYYAHIGPPETYQTKMLFSCDDERANPNYCF